MLGPTPVAEPETVTVAGGRESRSTFDGVTLTTRDGGRADRASSTSAAPFETDETNNTRARTVEVTEHELVRSNVLVPALGGYGAQFNQHVYAPVTNRAARRRFGDLEAKVKALEPQLVRIFYNDAGRSGEPGRHAELASFVETVRLAQEAGATINITYQTATVARPQPGAVDGALRGRARGSRRATRGSTNVRWVTIQNEPNTAAPR